eukprot:scaffold28708_cov46-Attheya_sp.AAC.2
MESEDNLRTAKSEQAAFAEEIESTEKVASGWKHDAQCVLQMDLGSAHCFTFIETFEVLSGICCGRLSVDRGRVQDQANANCVKLEEVSFLSADAARQWSCILSNVWLFLDKLDAIDCIVAS